MIYVYIQGPRPPECHHNVWRFIWVGSFSTTPMLKKYAQVKNWKSLPKKKFGVNIKNMFLKLPSGLFTIFSIISATEDSALSSQSREMESTSACGERCERWYSRKDE